MDIWTIRLRLCLPTSTTTQARLLSTIIRNEQTLNFMLAILSIKGRISRVTELEGREWKEVFPLSINNKRK